MKAMLPWHVRRSLSFARNSYARRHPPFSGVYKSYADAPQSPGYNDNSWAEISLNAASAARRQIGTRLPDLSPSKWLLPVLIQSMPGQVRVLDFGGAAGLDYANASIGFGDERRDISYHVVDMQGVCDAGRKIWSDRPNITFSHEMPEPDSRFDIVYAFSAVHCVEDFQFVLRRFTDYQPKAILLCKHPVYSGKSFVRGQVNMGKGRELAQWVVGIDEIEGTLAERGYKLAFRSLGEDDYNVDNFDTDHRVGRTANLLFTQLSTR